MDKRIVAIENYWVSIVRDTAEFQQIAKAENPEFNELLDCIYRLLKDSFIHEATEYALERWEKILGLVVTDDMTLDERRVKILTALSIKLPYTWRVLKEMLTTVLGEDKFVLDYINDETRLIVHTDRISEDKWDAIRSLLDNVLPENIVVSEYNHHVEVKWNELNKYAHCKSMQDLLSVNSDYKTDVTSDGVWVYPLPEMVRADMFMQKNTKLEVFEQDLPNLTVGDAWFTYSGLKRFKGDISKVYSASSMFAGTKLKYPEDFEANISSLSWGDNMFGQLEMSKDLALKIINLLPVAPKPNTSKITLGIHIDFQHDAELLEAIAQIDYAQSGTEGKKWRVAIQWNGTPTTSSASTFSLRRGMPVYARLGEMQAHDGTVENFLDWGHYVSDPEGYMEFTSLDEAREYFNIKEENEHD